MADCAGRPQHAFEIFDLALSVRFQRAPLLDAHRTDPFAMPKKSSSVYETVDAWEAVWGDGVVPTWLAGMTIGFVLLFPILKMMFPKTIKKHGAFLLAFEIVAFFPLFYCAYEGATAWWFKLDDFTTKEQRLYATSPHARNVLQCNFAFQTWDFFASMLHKETAAPEMLAHHLLAALLCYWAITMPYMHYYGVYFMGVAEVSSVPLVVVDICKYYPEVTKRFPWLDLASKLSFGILFLIVRDILWVWTAITVWKDGLGILKAGDFPEQYPGYVTAGVLLANVFFTTLQLLWTKKLWDGVVELLDGGKKEAEKGKKKRTKGMCTVLVNTLCAEIADAYFS